MGDEEADVYIAESLIASGRFDDAMAVRMHFTLYSMQYILYTIYYIPYTIYYILYTIYYTLHTMYYMLLSMKIQYVPVCGMSCAR